MVQVGTHADDPSLTEDDVEWGIKELRKKFPMYCFSGLRNFMAVSCRTGHGVKELRDALVKSVLGMLRPCRCVPVAELVAGLGPRRSH